MMVEVVMEVVEIVAMMMVEMGRRWKKSFKKNYVLFLF